MNYTGIKNSETSQATTEAQHCTDGQSQRQGKVTKVGPTQMKRALLLNIVIGERTPILELLARENQALLVRRDAFFVLNFCFYIVNGIRGLHLQGNSLAGQRLHKDLHATTETKYEV